MKDTIPIRDLSLRACTGSSAWNRPDADKKQQPVLVSLVVPYNLALAGATDDLAHSLNYGALAKAVAQLFDAHKTFVSLVMTVVSDDGTRAD